MNKEFCAYNISLKLKKLGFDEKCLGYYSNYNNKYNFHLYFIPIHKSDFKKYSIDFDEKFEYILAPLWQQVRKWLREIYKIHIQIVRDEDNWRYELYEFKNGNKYISSGFKDFPTYEQALEAGLKNALTLIKNE